MSKEFKVLLIKEFQDSLRNRWLITYALTYAVLGLSLSYYGILGLSYLGLKAFGRVSAALVNLSLYVVPLMSLSLSGLSIVSERERGTLEILLAQPVTRFEVMLSKYLGIALSVALSTTLGYGIAAWYLWLVLTSADLAAFLKIMLASLLLALALSAVGILISAVSRSRFEALASILLAWLTLVVIYDLLLMGIAIIADVAWSDILALLLLNPVESARMLMIHSIDPSLLFLGPTGLYLSRTLGPSLPLFFTTSLAAWAVVSIAVAARIFKGQDL